MGTKIQGKGILSYSLAGGCSYTDPVYYNHPVWPDYLNIDVNAAKCGASNSMIIDNVYDMISEKGNPKTLHILLTTWDRFSIYNQNVIPASYLKTPVESMSLERQEKFKLKHGAIDFALNNNSVGDILTDNLRKIYFLSLYCINNNIKLSLAQGCHLWDYTENTNKEHIEVNSALFKKQQVYNTLISNKYFSLIDDLRDKVKLVGWPFVKELGGECYNDIRDSSNVVSADDEHPNANGQKHIAEWFSK